MCWHATDDASVISYTKVRSYNIIHKYTNW